MTGRALCVASLAGPPPPALSALSRLRVAGSSSQAKSYQCIRQFLQRQTLGNVGLDCPVIQAPQVFSVGPVPWGETTAASGQQIWPLGFWLFPLRAAFAWRWPCWACTLLLTPPPPPWLRSPHCGPRDQGFPEPSPASLHICSWPSPMPLALAAGHIHCNSYVSSPEPQTSFLSAS